MKNKLTKTENKNGSFTYTVTDETGKVISTRKSKNGKYIACTCGGHFYFSRLDLIGKGDSKRFFESYPDELSRVAKMEYDFEIEAGDIEIIKENFED